MRAKTTHRHQGFFVKINNHQLIILGVPGHRDNSKAAVCVLVNRQIKSPGNKPHTGCISRNGIRYAAQPLIHTNVNIRAAKLQLKSFFGSRPQNPPGSGIKTIRAGQVKFDYLGQKGILNCIKPRICQADIEYGCVPDGSSIFNLNRQMIVTDKKKSIMRTIPYHGNSIFPYLIANVGIAVDGILENLGNLLHIGGEYRNIVQEIGGNELGLAANLNTKRVITHQMCPAPRYRWIIPGYGNRGQGIFAEGIDIAGLGEVSVQGGVE